MQGLKKFLFLSLFFSLLAFSQGPTLIQNSASPPACGTSTPTSLLCINGAAFNGSILVTTPNVVSNSTIYLPVPLQVTVNYGFYSFSLVPTDTALPAGSSYTFTYQPKCAAPLSCPVFNETVTVPTSGSAIAFSALGRSSQSSPPNPGVPTLFNPGETGPGYLQQGTQGGTVFGSLLPHIMYQPFSGLITSGITAYFWAGSITCTITHTYLVVDPGGSAQIDVWKTSAGSARPTVANSITGGNYPSVSGATVPLVGGVSGWTNTTVLANDNWAVNIVSVSNTTFLGFGLECDSN